MRIKHKTRRPQRKRGNGKIKNKTMKGGGWNNKSTEDIIDDALRMNNHDQFLTKYPPESLKKIFTKKYTDDTKDKISRDIDMIENAILKMQY